MTMTQPAATQNRSHGPSYQQLLDRDSRPENVPAILRWQHNEPIGDGQIPRERYVSREFHELEKERMWKRTWQMACREEDIPNVGDYDIYEILGKSLIVVRTCLLYTSPSPRD